MDKRDWLLLYLALPSTPNGDVMPIDPIRIMKGMFLFAMDGPVRPEEKYEFEPYSYGPCSFEIYRDLDNLEEDGHILSSALPGRTWPIYSMSTKGTSAAEKLFDLVDSAAINVLEEIKLVVAPKPFLDLLKYVYKKFPEYAERSLVTLPD